MTVLFDNASWAVDDPRRAFVEGAEWFAHMCGTLWWSGDKRIAEAEAERRFPDGKREPEDCLVILSKGRTA